ncbi:hypothetical protein MMPV_009549 [Pyropia vietnamensis]
MLARRLGAACLERLVGSSAVLDAVATAAAPATPHRLSDSPSPQRAATHATAAMAAFMVPPSLAVAAASRACAFTGHASRPAAAAPAIVGLRSGNGGRRPAHVLRTVTSTIAATGTEMAATDATPEPPAAVPAGVPVAVSVAPATSMPDGGAASSTNAGSDDVARAAEAGGNGGGGSMTAPPRAAAPRPPVVPGVTRRLRRDDVLDVTIESLAYGGDGLAWAPDGPGEAALAVLVKHAIPGDTVRVALKKLRRKPKTHSSSVSRGAHAEAVLLSRRGTAAAAVTPRCPHFGFSRTGGGGCGGCLHQHLRYETQLAEKAAQVAFLFRDLLVDGGGGSLRPIVPAPGLWGYRNKMEFSFGTRIWRVAKPDVTDAAAGEGARVPSAAAVADAPTAALPRPVSVPPPPRKVYPPGEDEGFVLGLHAPGRYDKLVPIDSCLIQPEPVNKVLAFLRTRTEELLLEPFDVNTATGYLRAVGLRSATDAAGRLQISVNLVTAQDEVPGRLAPLAAELGARFPAVTSVVHNVQASSSDRGGGGRRGAPEAVLYGERTIVQALCGLEFEMSANSFFQTSAASAAILYELIRDAADTGPTDTVVDLFCGTGTIGLTLAARAGRVVGVELVADAVANARRNAARNGVTNAAFYVGDLTALRGGMTLADVIDWEGEPPAVAAPAAAAPPTTNGGSASGEAAAAASVAAEAAAAPVADVAMDVVVVDPPRAGLHPKLVRWLASCPARRIVYVSCNAATQVRDVAALCGHDPAWRLTALTPLDMFPHTPHIETVGVLERVTGEGGRKGGGDDR